MKNYKRVKNITWEIREIRSEKLLCFGDSYKELEQKSGIKYTSLKDNYRHGNKLRFKGLWCKIIKIDKRGLNE